MYKYSIGIDSGSTFCKVALLDKENVLDRAIVKSGWQPSKIAENIVEAVLEKNGLSMEDCLMVSTGYGRESIDFAEKTLTEISAHSVGGIYLNPEIGGIIDIGGQDCKVIKIRNKKAMSFFMNDKCAAGTGRFLDMACQTLDIPIGEIDNFLQTNEYVNINSMCTVFAESEIIGLVSSSVDRSLILNGVLRSIGARIAQMLSKLQPDKNELFLMTGGLARSQRVVDTVSEITVYNIVTHADSSYAGAIGAAMFGFK
jgi:predicted CoA-substrate-specific enzyme activase